MVHEPYPLILTNKMKNKIYHTVGTIPTSNIKIVERGTIDTPNTQIHDRPCYWIGTGTSIKCGGVKLVLWGKTSPLSEMMWSYKCFLHMSKRQDLTYNRENSVIIKNAIILFILRDTDVVIYIILGY